MQIELTPVEAEELLDALAKLHALDFAEGEFIGLNQDWRSSQPLILLFAKLIRIANSGPKRAPLHK